MDGKRTRADIVAYIYERNYREIPATRIDNMVVDILDYISHNVIVEKNKIELRGFGSFSCKVSRRENAHNPRTLEPVKTVATRKVVFTPGKNCKQREE